MSLLRWFPIFATIIGLVFPAIGSKANPPENDCPPPALSRLEKHKVVAGETLESIANQYNLFPETLIGFNPSLKAGIIAVGSEILIPPFNGIRIDVPAGSSWQDLAEAYGVRSDILFEVNGCQQLSQQVFLPGVNWSRQGTQTVDSYTGFAGYPLPFEAPIGLSYGWRSDASSESRQFHSGIDLLAEMGTVVLSVDAGTVAFASTQGIYGRLVVINHQGGRQSRYAHLQNMSVTVGQQVQTGDIIGTVGVTGSRDLEQPHLHFEVRYNSPLGWVAQDPQLHLQSKPTAGR
ncbi:MAG: M23 family metallopeptidase [Symploca sp. SIO3C6]|uniref:M23 family metallopeptidase n=1 Tax=Symploca sp. SIO1C4 TaxID=2607765 RepID=A0A6B3N9L4_9CYAN|nr:M23 family metallopeptidase [Symploca sp. SIO3C6]NER26774.1 M23 family metallopeptidase [Symploca sp. SIO1C4]